MLDKLMAGLLTQAEIFIAGWKTFFLPAEPFHFAYSFSLNASQTLNNQTLDLRLPYDFYVYTIARGSTGLFQFLLKASGGGVYFGNAPIRSDTLWSDDHPAFNLRRPFKIEAGASLVVDLQDLSAATNVGQIVLYGYKAASQFKRPNQG